MSRRAWSVLCATALGIALAPESAYAHAFALRYDLPLPLGHYLVGAGTAVVLSFLIALSRRAPDPAPGRVVWRGEPCALVFALRIVWVAMFMLALAAGLFGNQDDWDTNILPVLVWVWWWVGLAFVSVLMCDLWPLLDPFAALAEWAGASKTKEKSASASAWPALLLFACFAWAELVWPKNGIPAQLAIAILIYAAIAWIGMAMLGVASWQERGDPFRLFFGLLGRVAPFELRRDGGALEIRVRRYGAGLAGMKTPSLSLTLFIVLALGTVSFDGIAETPLWEDFTGAALDVLYRAGLVERFGYDAAGMAVKTLGLIGTPALLFAVYVSACALAARIAGGAPLELTRMFAPALVPIAAAYHLAHYQSYLLIQGQALFPRLSDPFGFGWDLFGTRGFVPYIAAADAAIVWNGSVALIVAGHMLAVFLTHATAQRRRLGWRGEAPLAVLMVAYTMLSLWILSQPIVVV